MSGCLGWLFFGIFFGMYKIFALIIKGLWSLNLWLLQTISGRPLYYCKSTYLIPAKITGILGVLSLFGAILGLVILLTLNPPESRTGNPLIILIVYLAFGFFLLWASRFLIRRGSL
jgi:hypothetical protein